MANKCYHIIFHCILEQFGWRHLILRATGFLSRGYYPPMVGISWGTTLLFVANFSACTHFVHVTLFCLFFTLFWCTYFLLITLPFFISTCNVWYELGYPWWWRKDDGKYPKLCCSTIAWQVNRVLYIPQYLSFDIFLYVLEWNPSFLFWILPFKHFSRSSGWARSLYTVLIGSVDSGGILARNKFLC